MKYDERMEDYQKAVDLSTKKHTHTHTPMQCPYGKHPARPSAHMQTSKKNKWQDCYDVVYSIFVQVSTAVQYYCMLTKPIFVCHILQC